MLKIIGPRQSGKTTELIRRSSYDKKRIVCRDNNRAKNIMDLAEKNGYDIPSPVTLLHLTAGIPGNSMRDELIDRGFYIDDVEDVISQILYEFFGFPIKLEGYTSSAMDVLDHFGRGLPKYNFNTDLKNLGQHTK